MGTNVWPAAAVRVLEVLFLIDLLNLLAVISSYTTLPRMAVDGVLGHVAIFLKV